MQEPQQAVSLFAPNRFKGKLIVVEGIVWFGRVSHLLMGAKAAMVGCEGGTNDGRGSRAVSALSK
jgi:hypothetical protein